MIEAFMGSRSLIRWTSSLFGLLCCLVSASVPLVGQILDAQKVFDRCADAVVLITTPEGFGTGFLVSGSGHIITNHHVISGAEVHEIDVYTRTGAALTVESVDPILDRQDLDIAIVKISVAALPKPLPLVAMPARQGADVVAIGHPEGQLWTITKGIVSLANEHFVQTDIAINPGNSGGPVLDHRGRVVGVVTVKNTRMEGTSLAIPASDIMAVLKSRRVRFDTTSLILPSEAAVSRHRDVVHNGAAGTQDIVLERRALDSIAAVLRSTSATVYSERDSLLNVVRDERAKLVLEKAEAQSLLDRAGMIRDELERERSRIRTENQALVRMQAEAREELSRSRQERDELQDEVSRLRVVEADLRTRTYLPRAVFNVRLQSGYQHFMGVAADPAFMYGRADVGLGLRFGRNMEYQHGDQIGVSIGLMPYVGIAGQASVPQVPVDVSMYVQFDDDVRVQLGVGDARGLPLLPHQNYLFGQLAVALSSGGIVDWGFVASALKSNGLNSVSIGGGLWIARDFQFLRL